MKDNVTKSRIVYESLDFSSRPDAKVFDFTPPADAVKVDEPNTPSLPAGVAVGQIAPDFEALDLDGRIVKLSSLKRPVLLNFWFYNCFPCRQEHPDLQKICDEFQPRGVVFLAVNFGDSESLVAKYFAQGKFTFKPLRQREKEILEAYGVSSFPTNLVVSTEGKVLYRAQGFEPDKIKAALNQALGK